ncbi:MAG: ABC transporter substrate-binding protein [Trueperaceae bacterium]|nr:ABC transporter substrate-binding protein [Trueperaceae bacterium]
MRRFLLPLAALAIASFALADPFVWPNAWTSAEPGEAAHGGTFRDYAISDPRTFNPFVSAEENDVVDAANLTTLITQGPDSDEFIPYMAESFEVSDDGTTVTIHVREGMKWSDGEDITAQDFYFTYLAETDEDVGSNGYDSWFIQDELIEGTLVDEYTLRFDFPSPDRTALPVLAIAPAPDHILGEIYREGGAEALREAWGTETDISETVWATPFVPTEFTPGQRIRFERNEHFGEWNTDAQGNALPYLDRYVVQIVESTDAALNLYLAGEIDAYSPQNLDQVGVVNQAINNGDIDAELLPNVAPTASSQFIVFNWNIASDPFKESLFQNVNFRRAMSHLVDREALTDLVYGGSASPMWSNVYQVYDFWVNPDVPKYRYDPERATELLDQIGFTRTNDDGVLVDADGNELSFTLATNAGNAEREQIAQIFADTAREIGVEVDVQAVDFNLLVDQLLSTGDDRPFEAILIGLQGGNRVWPFGVNVIPCGTNLHAWNQSGDCLSSRETLAEELYFEGRRTLDTEEARQIGFQIQETLAELQAQVYTVSPLSHYSWLSEVGGEHPHDLIDDAVGSRELPLTFKVQ